MTKQLSKTGANSLLMICISQVLAISQRHNPVPKLICMARYINLDTVPLQCNYKVPGPELVSVSSDHTGLRSCIFASVGITLPFIKQAQPRIYYKRTR